MRKLQIEQLHQKMQSFIAASKVVVANEGWIRTVRSTLGMTLEQLGRKLSLTRQSVKAIEQREQDGSITLNALRQAAAAMDMKLVYGLVPVEGTLHTYIDRKASHLADKIVMRTSHSMMLEDQKNSVRRLEQAKAERKEAIIREMPKALWD